MATFQAKYLSDEDVAQELDLCYGQMILLREQGGVRTWHCPSCGARRIALEAGQPRGSHLRPQAQEVVSA